MAAPRPELNFSTPSSPAVELSAHAAHHRSLRAAGSALVAAALLAAGLAGCGTSSAAQVAEVGVVAGQLANNVPVAVSAEVESLAQHWVNEGAQLSVVVPDGQPAVEADLDLATTGPNSLYDREEAAANQHAALGALVGAKATTPQANPLGAITLAARAVRDAPGVKQVVVLNSGLQTVAPLSFQYGLLNEQPGAVVAYLRRTDELPDLHGVKVTWLGLGETSRPQPPLSTAELRRLRSIWVAVLDAAGASSVHVIASPLPSTPPVRGLPAVTTVPVTPPGTLKDLPQATRSPLVINLDPASVSFVPNEAEYLDPGEADAVLAVVAHQIRSGGYLHVNLTGTTALPPGITLSYARARRVAETLIGDGVPASSITVHGVGIHFAAFVADISPNGAFNPVAANQDRLVIITANR